MGERRCGGDSTRDDGMADGGPATETVTASTTATLVGAGGRVRVMAMRYARALPVLSAHGLAAGPAGYDPADLAAVAATRGWVLNAEPSRRVQGVQHWRATVLAHRCDLGNPMGITVAGTSAHGASESEAMAVALASMLARTTR
jgi:hypothetical protein